MDLGAPDNGVTRDIRTGRGFMRFGGRPRTRGNAPQCEEPSDRQNQNHEQREHLRLLQKPADIVPYMFLLRK